MSGFTHFNEDGNAVMVDVGAKAETKREALASGVIRMSEECFQKVKEGSMKKGDVLGVARIAGIMGAKKTAELIPLCHLLNLTKVEIDFEYLEEEHGIRAICHTACTGRTGVEMEALTGVNVALLTIYDMCKAVDKGMEINEVHLLRKSGGKSGVWERRLTGEWRSEKSICLKSPVEKAGNGYVKRILISGKKSKYLQLLTVEKTQLIVYNRF